MARTEHTPFGDYEVFPDGSGGLDPASNQVTESELAALRQSWDSIHRHGGMNIQGSRHDRAEWDGILRDGMSHSEEFRREITAIGEDTNPQHAFDVNLGHDFGHHGQPPVVGDQFARAPGHLTGHVDLSDLERLPTDPQPGHHNEVTRREEVLHFLEERHLHAAQGLPFDPAHDAGIAAQNRYRDERGETHIAEQRLLDHDRDGTPDDLAIRFQDGTREHVWFDRHGDFISVDPPFDAPPNPFTP